jgi:2-polyprenyl-3-methyl-5-hydroxy-6-metoxy-1,4-benzoquinol methylase
MVMIENKISSKDDYVHSAEAPESNDILHIPIISVLQRLNARKVLDIGCGNGSLLKSIRMSINGGGYQLVGMEPSESGVSHARRLLPDKTSAMSTWSFAAPWLSSSAIRMAALFRC